MVTINIKNKHLYLISAIMIFLVGVGLVISGGGTGAGEVGHYITEIDPPSGCTSGQVLSWDGSVWSCEDDDVSSCQIRTASATQTISCNAGETATGGGAECYGGSGHPITEHDPTLYNSHPTGTTEPTGWYASCKRVDSGAIRNPHTIYVVCCS